MLPGIAKAQLSYTTNNGSITITAYTGSEGAVTIPSTTNGLPVSSIGDSAFYGCTWLTNITIPDSITSIGYAAFCSCTGLSSITIPKNLTEIEYYAFASCYSLTNVAIPDNVTIIRDGAFDSCANLTSLTIGNGVSTIGDYAFYECAALANITMGSNVVSIGNSAFYGCSNLIQITFPDSLTAIGSEAFSYCTALTDIAIPNNCTCIGDSSFLWCASLTNLTIGSGVTNIGALAFYYSPNLAAITVDPLNPAYSGPDGVLLGNGGTTLLQFPGGKSGSYTIPASVTSIGPEAFSCSFQLTNITIPSSITKIGNGAFHACTSLARITIPDSVTNLGEAAFFFCTNLTSVTISRNLTSIPVTVFGYCYVLNGVYFRGDAPVVADSTLFDGDSNAVVYYFPGTTGWGTTFGGVPAVLLPYTYTTGEGTITITGYAGPDTDVTIPDMIEGLPVTCIGAFAFSGRSALSSITIPGTVTSIGDYAFLTGPGGGMYGASASTNLTTITVAPDNPNYSSVEGVLFNKSKTTLLQYPPGKPETSYTLFSRATGIGQHAFDGCNRLANVTIPTSVTQVGDGAFFLCTSLTNVVLPESVATIGSQAFYGCASLTSFTIPASVTNLGAFALFSSITYGSDGVTTNLTAITVEPENLNYSSVDGVLFDKNQTTLLQYPAGRAGTSYTLPNSVTSIAECAFSGCPSLVSVTVPASVTNIDGFAFGYCTTLASAYLEGDAPAPAWSVFYGADRSTVYYLPGTSGWGSTFGERPTALWQPKIQTSQVSFRVCTNLFGFDIAWASGRTVVVEACTDLANPVWVPVATNALTGGSFYFTDPQRTNYPTRLYRLRGPRDGRVT